MRRCTLPMLLGLSHSVADGAAGLLLAGLPQTMTLKHAGVLILLYNLLAFGAQPLVGALADRWQQPRAAATAGLGLLGLALAIANWQLELAVALAGLGSAAFHAGGGALALASTRDRATGPGLFAAPGAVGLAVGGALAVTGHAGVWPVFSLLLAVAACIIARCKLPRMPYREPHAKPSLEGGELVIVVLLAAVALRSGVWSAFQFLRQGETEIVMAMALAATTGKAAGGLLADWLGWRRWTVMALALAAPLLALGGSWMITLLFGVALLQSATPAALAAVARLLPRQPATAAGLALGLAILLGGLQTINGLSSALAQPWALAAVLAAAAISLCWALAHARAELR